MVILILSKFDTSVTPVNNIIIGYIDMLFILLFLLLLILLTGFFTLLSLVFGSVDLICVTSQPQAHIFYDLVIFLL